MHIVFFNELAPSSCGANERLAEPVTCRGCDVPKRWADSTLIRLSERACRCVPGRSEGQITNWADHRGGGCGSATTSCSPGCSRAVITACSTSNRVSSSRSIGSQSACGGEDCHGHFVRRSLLTSRSVFRINLSRHTANEEQVMWEW